MTSDATIRTRAALAALLAAVAVAIAPAIASGAPRDFFTVSPATTVGDADAAKMKSGRLKSVRLLITWSNVEQAPGVYTWGSIDAQVLRAAERGIRVDPYVYGTPSWLAGKRSRSPVKVDGGLAAWKDFITALVQRYGRGGSFWEDDPNGPLLDPPSLRDQGIYEPFKFLQIWGEQNSPTFWSPRPAPREYAKLLKKAHSAASDPNADPRLKLVTGGMFATPARAKSIRSDRFLKKVYGVRGAKRSFDAVGINPYASNLRGVRWQMNLLRRAMKQKNDGRTPMRVSELGWATDGNPRSNPLNKGRKGQAKMLRAGFRLMLDKRRSWNVDQVAWYTWRDHDQDCAWCFAAGLFNKQLEAKPSWRAFKRFTR